MHHPTPGGEDFCFHLLFHFAMFALLRIDKMKLAVAWCGRCFANEFLSTAS